MLLFNRIAQTIGGIAKAPFHVVVLFSSPSITLFLSIFSMSLNIIHPVFWGGGGGGRGGGEGVIF